MKNMRIERSYILDKSRLMVISFYKCILYFYVALNNFIHLHFGFVVKNNLNRKEYQ